MFALGFHRQSETRLSYLIFQLLWKTCSRTEHFSIQINSNQHQTLVLNLSKLLTTFSNTPKATKEIQKRNWKHRYFLRDSTAWNVWRISFSFDSLSLPLHRHPSFPHIKHSWCMQNSGTTCVRFSLFPHFLSVVRGEFSIQEMNFLENIYCVNLLFCSLNT